MLRFRLSRFLSYSLPRLNENNGGNSNGPLDEFRKLSLKIPKSSKMPPRPSIPESDISEKFIKGGSGKGGQKINKTNSKVQLTHKPTGLVVTSQATRSRDQNRKIARQILAMKIEEMEKGIRSRAQVLIARKQMVKQRAKKKTKAKYKKLAAEKENNSVNNGNNDDEEVVIIVDDDDDEVIKPTKKET